MSNWKGKTRQFAVDLSGGNSVAESEKLVMNQILISKCLKIKIIVAEGKLKYESN
jgi:hypothetical protein